MFLNIFNDGFEIGGGVINIIFICNYRISEDRVFNFFLFIPVNCYGGKRVEVFNKIDFERDMWMIRS